MLQFLANTRLLNGMFGADPEPPHRVVGFVIADPLAGISDWDKDTVRKPYLLRVLSWLADQRLFNTVAIHFNLEEVREDVPMKLLAPFPFMWYADNLADEYFKHPEFFAEYCAGLVRNGAHRAIIDDANVKYSRTVVREVARVAKAAGLTVIASFNAVGLNDNSSAFIEDMRGSDVAEFAFQGYIGNTQTVDGKLGLTGWLDKLKKMRSGVLPEYAHIQSYRPNKTGASLPVAKLRTTFMTYWRYGVRSVLIYGFDEFTDWSTVDLTKDPNPEADHLIALLGLVAWMNAQFQDEDASK